MTKEGHLLAIPRPEKDENTGQDIIEYTSFMRGLLEELEKAHVYISKLSDALKEQRTAFAKLSAQVEAAVL